MLQCDHSDLWELCECDANTRCWARHSNRTSVLNPGACPALRDGRGKGTQRVSPGHWEAVGSQLVCQGSGCRGWEFSTGTAGSGHSSTLSPGMAGAALTAPTEPPLPQPSQRGPSVAQRGSQNGHWLWGGQGSRDPDTHGHPLLLLPSQEPTGQAPGTCWAQLPGLDTRLKDSTSPEALPVHPELGKIQVWDRKICFPHFLFMAQQKKKKSCCKIQARGQP